MKGCLKVPSRAPSPAALDLPRKTVCFRDDGEEQIWLADEWDRTPVEPARNLSYQDILELKEIQQSLPRAQQPADKIAGKPASQFLSTVPIGLLPLLPETTAPPPPPPNVPSTFTPSQSSWRTVRTPAPSIPYPQPSTWHPPHLSHLPAGRPPIDRQKPRFAFLPLLETAAPHPSSSGPSSPVSPPPSERSMSPDFAPSDSDVSHDLPTPSLTNASLDSSPLSRASSCSPEPLFFQLPPSKYPEWKKNFAMYSDDQVSPDEWNNLHYAQGQIRRPGFGASRAAIPIPPAPSTPKKSNTKKRNVIVVNDIEIELDDDDGAGGDDEEEGSTPPAKASPVSMPIVSSPSPVRPSVGRSILSSPSTSPTLSFTQPATLPIHTYSVGSALWKREA